MTLFAAWPILLACVSFLVLVACLVAITGEGFAEAERDEADGVVL